MCEGLYRRRYGLEAVDQTTPTFLPEIWDFCYFVGVRIEMKGHIHQVHILREMGCMDGQDPLPNPSANPAVS